MTKAREVNPGEREKRKKTSGAFGNHTASGHAGLPSLTVLKTRSGNSELIVYGPVMNMRPYLLRDYNLAYTTPLCVCVCVLMEERHVIRCCDNIMV